MTATPVARLGDSPLSVNLFTLTGGTGVLFETPNHGAPGEFNWIAVPPS